MGHWVAVPALALFLPVAFVASLPARCVLPRVVRTSGMQVSGLFAMGALLNGVILTGVILTGAIFSTARFGTSADHVDVSSQFTRPRLILASILDGRRIRSALTVDVASHAFFIARNLSATLSDLICVRGADAFSCRGE
jgi:hypothetical protein